MAQSRTVGVEEELFLVDPETRLPSASSPRVLKHAAEHEPEAQPDDLDHEFFEHQLETRTPPTESLEELRSQLVRGRRLAAQSADATGLVTLASGTLPVHNTDPRVTREDRYLDMVGTYGEVTRPGGTCGMHVHVHVESPAVGVAVIDHLVPWLPVILAISANSPFYQGRDTAYASWRSQVWAQWPSAGPTEALGSLETYREVSRQMRESACKVPVRSRVTTSGSPAISTASQSPGDGTWSARATQNHSRRKIRSISWAHTSARQ